MPPGGGRTNPPNTEGSGEHPGPRSILCRIRKHIDDGQYQDLFARIPTLKHHGNSPSLWAILDIMKDLNLTKLPSQAGKTILITGGMFNADPLSIFLVKI